LPKCAAAWKRRRERFSISWSRPCRFGWPVKALGCLVFLQTPLQAEQIGPQILDRLPPADVVILGEVHDNPQHHKNQARAVAALQPRAIVFEMLTPQQAALTPADIADADALALAYAWAQSGWPDFALYHPVFLAAPGARIFGGDLPPGAARRAVGDGAAAVFGPDAALYGLADPLPPADQQAREAEQRSAHCDALPDTLLSGMVEAQRLRNAALARAVVQALDDTGGPVAVITGTGHARVDRGIPAVLARVAPDMRVLSIGQIEGVAGPNEPFDLWIVTDPVPRDDPCAAFAPDATQDG